MLRIRDLERMICPFGGGRLVPEVRPPVTRPDGPLRRGALRSQRTGEPWPIRDEFVHLYRERDVIGTDKLMRRFYDGLPSAHDPAVRWLLPIIQGSGEAALRDAYMRRLELRSLAPRADGEPVRILEVGAGAGANLALLLRDAPRGLPLEIWAMDLSAGMLRHARRRAGRLGIDVRFFVGDAHALPFPDDSFDRVFHVGGIGAFRQPARALAEMGRVAEPDTPVVVVDEQLDPAGGLTWPQRALFRLFTFWDPAPRCPIDAVPPNADPVIDEQISRCFYCLTFRAPSKMREAHSPERATDDASSSSTSSSLAASW